jgi:hypothetical protein
MNGTKIVSDSYFDERNQMILIDYESSLINYYYHWDVHNKTYANVAVYSFSEVDNEIDIDEITQTEPERFSMTFNRFATYDVEKEKWSKWQEGKNTFVINANTEGDIVHYMASGNTAIYKKTSKVKMDETDGYKYQIIEAVDDDGIGMSFQVFNDEKLGVKMIYSNVIFQFSK